MIGDLEKIKLQQYFNATAIMIRENSVMLPFFGRLLASWLIAVITSKVIYLLYPQIDTMCSSQSWLDCISIFDWAKFLQDPITVLISGVLVVFTFLFFYILSLQISLQIVVVAGLASGFITIAIYPSILVSSLETYLSDRAGIVAGIAVWCLIMFLPIFACMSVNALTKKL